MASSVVGALRVNLSLNSAQFSKGLTGAKAKMQGFGRAAKAGLAVVAAAFATTAVALGAAVKGMIDHADDMQKLSQGIGLSVEQLTAWGHAAQLAGVPIDGFAKGVKKLSQNMLLLSQGMTSESTRAFAQLGISVLDASGRLRSSEDVMLDVAQAFSNMKDGAEKTGLAMQLFGKAGADLIPLLNGGKDAILKMKQEAEDLGIVISDKTGKAAEEFNDTLLRIKQIFNGIILKITAAFLPGLQVLASGFLDTASDANSLNAAIGELAGVFDTVVLAVVRFAGDLRIAKTEIVETFMALKKIGSGDFSGALQGVIDANRKSVAASAALNAQMAETKKTLTEPLPADIPIKKTIEDIAIDLTIVNTELGRLEPPARRFTGKMWEAKKATEGVGSSARAASVEVGKIAKTADRIEPAMDDAFSSIIGGIRGVLEGTKDWKSALIDVAEQLVNIGLQQLKIGQGGAGGGGGIFSGIGSLFSGLFGGLFGAAGGGDFTVNGKSGIDNNVGLIKLGDRETLRVLTPQQKREEQSPAVPATIINQTNTINVQTPDLRGFQESLPQTLGKMAEMTRQGARQL